MSRISGFCFTKWKLIFFSLGTVFAYTLSFIPRERHVIKKHTISICHTEKDGASSGPVKLPENLPMIFVFPNRVIYTPPPVSTLLVLKSFNRIIRPISGTTGTKTYCQTLWWISFILPHLIAIIIHGF